MKNCNPLLLKNRYKYNIQRFSIQKPNDRETQSETEEHPQEILFKETLPEDSSRRKNISEDTSVKNNTKLKHL